MMCPDTFQFISGWSRGLTKYFPQEGATRSCRVRASMMGLPRGPHISNQTGTLKCSPNHRTRFLLNGIPLRPANFRVTIMFFSSRLWSRRSHTNPRKKQHGSGPPAQSHLTSFHHLPAWDHTEACSGTSLALVEVWVRERRLSLRPSSVPDELCSSGQCINPLWAQRRISQNE